MTDRVSMSGGTSRRARRTNRLRPVVAAAVAGLACVGLGGAAARAGEAPAGGRAQLVAEIRALEARVRQLQATGEGAARDAGNDAAAVDRTVDRVLRDADGRGQLMAAEGFTAGYDNGKFLIQSADGGFVLNPSIQFQFRYAANVAEDFQDDGDQDGTDGFEVRRLRLVLAGNVFGKDTSYYTQWGTGRNGGALLLEEAWVRRKFADTPFSARVGQFVNPFYHEARVSGRRQLAAERSYLHETIVAGGIGSEDYVQGVSGSYEGKVLGNDLRAEVIYHDGFNSRNTDYQDAGGSTVLTVLNPQWAVAGRVDYKLAGDWRQYDDFTALGNTKGLLVVGGGFDYNSADNVNAFFHTVDVQWEPEAEPGVALYAAFVGLSRDFRNLDDGPSTYDWGFLVQGSYLLDDQLEVFARYDFTNLDNNAPGAAGTIGAGADVEDKVHEITVGVNYYFHGHASKLTVDATFLPSGAPVGASGANIRGQSNDEEQFVFRAQYQLLL